LAGECDNPATNDALRRLLKEQIFTGKVFVNGNDSLSLAVHPETWEARLPELIPGYQAEKLERYHYLCRALKFDWRANLPARYSVHRVDHDLLDDPAIVFPDPWREWFDPEQMWGTKENFLARGISFCVLHDREVVAWCTPDCMAGDQIDVGIVTHRAHRRKGLGSIAVAATVEYCLQHGFAAVGWHCNAENIASWKLAEKVGFERNREYAYYYYMYDPTDHLAELGWYYFRRGEYAKTVQYYERVFGERKDNPDYYYHLTAVAWAALGNSEHALKYLNAAIEHGWNNVEYTEQTGPFSILHGTPEWEAALARMRQSEDGSQ